MRRLLIFMLALLSSSVARATDLHNVITDFTVTTWNEKDGLPPATIFALAQDQDGYLWIGTRQGLLRFDGVRFTRWEGYHAEPLPTAGVRSLLVTRTGAMWVGFVADGSIARVADGHLTVFTGATGLGGGAVLTLTEDGDGVIWTGGDRGLFTFDGTRFVRSDRTQGVPDGAVYSTFADRAGNVYAALKSDVLVRPAHAPAFEHAASFDDTFGGFAETPDGTVWVTDATSGYRPLRTAARSGVDGRQGRGLRMVVDRKGSLWVGTGGQGLWRARKTSAPVVTLERTTSLTGLLGDGVYALLLDRAGNIWAGTTEGLNRLTPRTFEQIVDLGLARGVELEPDGRVWIGTVDRVFNYSATVDGRRREVPIPADARAMAVDEHGVWVATAKGIVHVDRDGRSAPVHWPLEQQAGEVHTVTLDGHGGLWLVTDRLGIVRWHGADARPLAVPDAFRSAHATAVFVRPSGEAWFAFDNGRVLRVAADGSTTTLPGTERGGPPYRVIVEDQTGRVWLGGDTVLAAFEGGALHTLGASPRFPVQAVTAIVTDDRGAVWLGSPLGVVHLERAEFDRASADGAASPRYTVYSRSDGIAGTPLAVGFNRGAVRTPDGRLWFITTRGVTVLDPHVLQARSAPIAVRFEGAMADDSRLDPGARMMLAAGTRKLEVDYTVVNLTSPLRTRFKYRLDPFDHDWVDAGGRRQAFYTNLRPGSYVFHVSAADATGGTPPSESAWALSVAPMFYQTTTFATIVSLSVGLLILAGWRLRERHLRRQFSLLIAERARLGREIHDTLLQGLVAIALQFDSLAHELSPMPRLQDRFLRLRDRVEEYIREARRSIWDLHTQPVHRNLVDSLRRAGEFATDGREIAFTLQVQGTPCPCPPRVEEQVVRIAQEAALNSVRHAAPRRLRINLMYDHEAVTLTVADDGRGFDAEQRPSSLHYGITSMQERARSVGGALTLVSAPGHGTEVTAVLPIAS